MSPQQESRSFPPSQTEVCPEEVRCEDSVTVRVGMALSPHCLPGLQTLLWRAVGPPSEELQGLTELNLTVGFCPSEMSTTKSLLTVNLTVIGLTTYN